MPIFILLKRDSCNEIIKYYLNNFQWIDLAHIIRTIVNICHVICVVKDCIPSKKEISSFKLTKFELKENLIVRDFIKRKMSDDCASEHDLLVMPNQDVK